MKILVTGGSGLLGSALLNNLKEFDYQLIGTYHTSPPLLLSENIKYIQVDLKDPQSCYDVTEGMNAVFLCAAQTGGIVETQESTKPVINTLRINAQMLDACNLAQVQRVFLISSTTIYPDSQSALVEQCGFTDDPCAPYFGIGWMNRYFEKLAQYYRDTFHLPVTIIRPTNMYGPRDNFSDKGAHVIPSLIKKFLLATHEVRIWGDGSQQRDFIFVEDVSDLLLKLLQQSFLPGPYNIGQGVGTSIRSLVNLLAELTDKTDINIEYDTTKLTGAPIRLVDTNLVKKEVGFTPKYSLSEGLKNTINWYQQIQMGEMD